MKIIWLSANIFGFKVLEHVQSFAPGVISEVITLDGSSKTVMYDKVRSTDWNKFDIPVRYVKDSVELEKVVASLSPDLVFMCGWRQIIPEAVLALSKKGVIGFHPTLLPKGRGPAPIINTILEGWKKSGLTMFYVSSQVDAGDIIGQESFAVSNRDDSEAVYNKVINAGCILLDKLLYKILDGNAPRIPQDERDATYLPKRSLKDNEILITDSVEEMDRKVRAFSYPYRGAFIRDTGGIKKKLVIWRANIENDK